MAVTPAITWAQVIRNAKNPGEAGILKQWLEVWDTLGDLPIVTNGSLNVKWKEETLLATVGSRRLNKAFTPGTFGGWDERGLDIPIYGDTFDIDHELLDEPGGPEEVQFQISSKNRALAYKFAYDVIYGDSASNPDGMDGLRVQLANYPSRNTIDASGLDMTTESARKTAAPELVRLMHQAVLRIRQGTGAGPNLILMDDDMFLMLSDAMRQSGFLTTTMDAQEREVTKWMGAKISLGGFQADQSTALIGANHDGNGYTSIYFLRTGRDYVHILQKHAPRWKVLGKESKEMGTTDDGIWIRRMLEWPAGIRMKHKFSAVRLKGIDITP